MSIAKVTLKRQIERTVPRLSRGLCYLEVDGDAWIGQENVVKLALPWAGFAILERMQTPLFQPSRTRPIQAVMWGKIREFDRKGFYEKKIKPGVDAQKRDAAREKEAIDHELKADLRNLQRDRVMVAQNGGNDVSGGENTGS